MPKLGLKGAVGNDRDTILEIAAVGEAQGITNIIDTALDNQGEAGHVYGAFADPRTYNNRSDRSTVATLITAIAERAHTGGGADDKRHASRALRVIVPAMVVAATDAAENVADCLAQAATGKSEDVKRKIAEGIKASDSQDAKAIQNALIEKNENSVIQALVDAVQEAIDKATAQSPLSSRNTASAASVERPDSTNEVVDAAIAVLDATVGNSSGIASASPQSPRPSSRPAEGTVASQIGAIAENDEGILRAEGRGAPRPKKPLPPLSPDSDGGTPPVEQMSRQSGGIRSERPAPPKGMPPFAGDGYNQGFGAAEEGLYASPDGNGWFEDVQVTTRGGDPVNKEPLYDSAGGPEGLTGRNSTSDALVEPGRIYGGDGEIVADTMGRGQTSPTGSVASNDSNDSWKQTATFSVLAAGGLNPDGTAAINASGQNLPKGAEAVYEMAKSTGGNSPKDVREYREYDAAAPGTTVPARPANESTYYNPGDLQPVPVFTDRDEFVSLEGDYLRPTPVDKSNQAGVDGARDRASTLGLYEPVRRKNNSSAVTVGDDGYVTATGQGAAPVAGANGTAEYEYQENSSATQGDSGISAGVARATEGGDDTPRSVIKAEPPYDEPSRLATHGDGPPNQFSTAARRSAAASSGDIWKTTEHDLPSVDELEAATSRSPLASPLPSVEGGGPINERGFVNKPKGTAATLPRPPMPRPAGRGALATQKEEAGAVTQLGNPVDGDRKKWAVHTNTKREKPGGGALPTGVSDGLAVGRRRRAVMNTTEVVGVAGAGGGSPSAVETETDAPDTPQPLTRVSLSRAAEAGLRKAFKDKDYHVSFPSPSDSKKSELTEAEVAEAKKIVADVETFRSKASGVKTEGGGSHTIDKLNAARRVLAAMENFGFDSDSDWKKETKEVKGAIKKNQSTLDNLNVALKAALSPLQDTSDTADLNGAQKRLAEPLKKSVATARGEKKVGWFGSEATPTEAQRKKAARRVLAAMEDAGWTEGYVASSKLNGLKSEWVRDMRQAAGLEQSRVTEIAQMVVDGAGGHAQSDGDVTVDSALASQQRKIAAANAGQTRTTNDQSTQTDEENAMSPAPKTHNGGARDDLYRGQIRRAIQGSQQAPDKDRILTAVEESVFGDDLDPNMLGKIRKGLRNAYSEMSKYWKQEDSELADAKRQYRRDNKEAKKEYRDEMKDANYFTFGNFMLLALACLVVVGAMILTGGIAAPAGLGIACVVGGGLAAVGLSIKVGKVATQHAIAGEEYREAKRDAKEALINAKERAMDAKGWTAGENLELHQAQRDYGSFARDCDTRHGPIARLAAVAGVNIQYRTPVTAGVDAPVPPLSQQQQAAASASRQ